MPLKRTKILATIGPATASYNSVLSVIREGANGLRLNFSHGSPEERLEQIEWIRRASAEHNRPVAILQDLQGPKIRLGNLINNRFDVKKGDEIVLDSAAEHDGGSTLPVQYNLAEKVKPGEPIYLFDGKIRTVVTAVESDTAIRLRVENDGILMSRKGINLPDTDFGGDILTEKDLADIEFGADKDIDYVALSFVQTAADIENLRQILLSHGSRARIIAKVETKVAIMPENLEAIVRASDGVMVARGDLAVEAGAEIVPVVQQEIISLCRKYGKLSIVATQMMGSMVDNPEPSRAEVSDVANAVMQGADVVMLSDETANGHYPLEAVAAMRKTIIYTQEHTGVRGSSSGAVVAPEDLQENAIAHAAVGLADMIQLTAIIAETKSGATVENIAACRPLHPILAVTSDLRVAQQLALTYATRPFLRPDGEKAGLKLAKELQEQRFFGDAAEIRVVVVSGRQPGVAGGTDTIRVRSIKD